MNNIEKGQVGENIASKYLLSKGAQILEKNYKIRSGEIDIIAKLNDELVFVEVKARSNDKYGTPAEAVNYKKIEKIIHIAKYYMLINDLYDVPMRFDVVEVCFGTRKLNHIENAF